MNTMKKIGFIGTGVMGNSMAHHLLAMGYEVRVYTRTKEKASSLIEKGASWVNTPGKQHMVQMLLLRWLDIQRMWKEYTSMRMVFLLMQLPGPC